MRQSIVLQVLLFRYIPAFFWLHYLSIFFNEIVFSKAIELMIYKERLGRSPLRNENVQKETK